MKNTLFFEKIDLNTITFTDFCTLYWKENPSKKTTTRQYRLDKIKCIETYARPYFKSLQLNQIAPVHISDFLERLVETPTRFYKLALKKDRPYYKNKYLATGTIKLIRLSVVQPLQFLEAQLTQPDPASFQPFLHPFAAPATQTLDFSSQQNTPFDVSTDFADCAPTPNLSHAWHTLVDPSPNLSHSQQTSVDPCASSRTSAPTPNLSTAWQNARYPSANPCAISRTSAPTPNLSTPRHTLVDASPNLSHARHPSANPSPNLSHACGNPPNLSTPWQTLPNAYPTTLASAPSPNLSHPQHTSANAYPSIPTPCPNRTFNGMVAPRDIFTTRELNQLTQSRWANPRAKMMFLLARYTGMRNGELRALQIKSIHKSYIDITTAYNNADGLKPTKNGKIRRFPISPSLYTQILRYISTLPDTTSTACLFPSLTQPGKPVGTSFANTHLSLQMKKLGIPKTRLEGTFIVTRTFHSLRHCMDTFLTSRTTLPVTTISKLMGHSPKMVQHYSSHYSDELFRLAARTLRHSALWSIPSPLRTHKNTPHKKSFMRTPPSPCKISAHKERNRTATGLSSFAVLRGSSLAPLGTKGSPARARHYRQDHRPSATHKKIPPYQIFSASNHHFSVKLKKNKNFTET